MYAFGLQITIVQVVCNFGTSKFWTLPTQHKPKKEQDQGWLSILKEALAGGKGVLRVEFPQVHTAPRIASSAH